MTPGPGDRHEAASLPADPAVGSWDAAEEPGRLAAELLTTSFPVTRPELPAGTVRRSLLGRSFDAAGDVAVVRDGLLVGLVPIERLLAASEETTMGTLMDPDPPKVAPGISREVAAWKAVQHGESGLAVVDGRDRLLGLIPARRMLGALLREHEEDMARLGGFLHDTATTRAAARQSVWRRFLHRLPWLLVGLLGALLAARLVGAFQRQLESDVTVAFFIPAVVYLAAAVGVQTETLLIRELSLALPVVATVWRELATGTLVGVVLASLFLPLGLLVWEQHLVVKAVALALVAASAAATVVAVTLPVLLARLGLDPALGSGPMATLAQDLLSILIYFEAVAVLL